MAATLEWNGKTRVVLLDGRLSRYSVVYLRKHADGWYDEARYDSHDRTRGKFQEAPHFHLKLRSPFKTETDAAEQEIRDIIEKELASIELIAGRPAAL